MRVEFRHGEELLRAPDIAAAPRVGDEATYDGRYFRVWRVRWELPVQEKGPLTVIVDLQAVAW